MRATYTPDRKAERFPEPFAASGPLKLDILWAEYRRSLQPSQATVKRWYPILTKFMAFVGTEDICGRIWDAETGDWKRERVIGPLGRMLTRYVYRDPQTVANREPLRRYLMIGLYTGTRDEAIRDLRWECSAESGGIVVERDVGGLRDAVDAMPRIGMAQLARSCRYAGRRSRRS